MKISNASLQGAGSLQGANRGAQLQDWGLQGGQVCLVSSRRIMKPVCKVALVPFYPSASLGLFQEWERLLLTILITIRGGKDCWTEFERLSFNGSTSVVLCRPHTGRMHQIRVHLQFLGEDRSLYFIFYLITIFDSQAILLWTTHCTTIQCLDRLAVVVGILAARPRISWWRSCWRCKTKVRRRPLLCAGAQCRHLAWRRGGSSSQTWGTSGRR